MIVILYIRMARCLIHATKNHDVEALWRLPIDLSLMQTKMSSPLDEVKSVRIKGTTY